jgi:hypothetical protein
MIVDFLIFDWNSFWLNIIAGLVIFILGIIVSHYSHRMSQRKNRKYLISKIDVILREFCEFMIESPFRDGIINSEQISVYTKKNDLKNYKFVALCPVNVFNKIVFPKMTLVIYDYFKDKNPNESYELFSDEYDRLKAFRLEIERILAVHSLHMDDGIILKISNLCFDIKALESEHKTNLVYDDLLVQSGSERSGFFGKNELPKIYENLLYLTKELISLNYFEYNIEEKK